MKVFLSWSGDKSRAYFGAIERGEFNVSLDTVMRLAGALGVSASMIFAGAGL